MPLTGQEATRLADELSRELNDPTLQLWATDMDINLPNLAPAAGSLKERALKLVLHLNGLLPPRDRELLELLVKRGNARLKAVAGDLLKPKFLSPTNDAHDAIVLGKAAFIARNDLRKALREFTNPSPYSTRVLIVRGHQPGGKSYSFEFLRHLAFQVDAQAMRLRGGGIDTPRELLARALRLLNLDVSDLPVLTDDPQLAKVDAFIDTFKAKILTLQKRHWLVIDDLNDPSVKPAVREAAFAMACSVEELRPQHLWLALLGYNEALVAQDLRHVAKDDAEFPDVSLAAKHLELIAAASGTPLTSQRAREIADLMFSKYPKLDKGAMTSLTLSLEQMGEKLMQGLVP